MATNLERIAKVSIDIATPISDVASFDYLLLLAPAPNAYPSMNGVRTYRSVKEMLDEGWSLEDKVYENNLFSSITLRDSDNKYGEVKLSGSSTTLLPAGQYNFVVHRDLSDNTATVMFNYESVGNGNPIVTVESEGKKLTYHVTVAYPFKATAHFNTLSTVVAGANKNTWMEVYAIAQADAGAVAAQVAFSQNPKPDHIFVAPIPGNSTPMQTLIDATGTDGWYVVCPVGLDLTQTAERTDGADITLGEQLARTVEAFSDGGVGKMMVYTELKNIKKTEQTTVNQDSSGAVTGTTNLALQVTNRDYQPTVGNIYERTAGIYGLAYNEDGERLTINDYLNVAWTVKWLYYDSGSETAAFKRLVSVYPSELTTTDVSVLAEKHLSYFNTIGGRNITMNGQTMAGEWMDVIRFRDWLTNDMQVRLVNLFVTNPKIPYTDKGIALIKAQMILSLMEGQRRGGIAPTEYDEFDNEIPGFSVSVPRASSITSVKKHSRVLSDCRFTARLAGAIHLVEVEGTLAYEL